MGVKAPIKQVYLDSGVLSPIFDFTVVSATFKSRFAKSVDWLQVSRLVGKWDPCPPD